MTTTENARRTAGTASDAKQDDLVAAKDSTATRQLIQRKRYEQGGQADAS